MKLDTATIVVVSVVIDFVMVLILFHTWRTRTTYPGFTAWIIGTACWSVGSIFTVLLSTMHPPLIPKIIGNGLILIHPVLLYEGIRQFHGIHTRWWGTPLNFTLVLVGICNQLYFFYIFDNIIVRSINIGLLMAIFFSRIALEPLFFPRIRSYSMQWLLSLSLLPLVVLLLVRGWVLLSESPLTTYPTMISNDTLLRWIHLYGIFAELVIAYCYLSLTSDRVEEDLRSERKVLIKTIEISVHYQTQLQELNSRIKGQTEVQERFLDMISHEYRTPLAIIQANIDVIELKDQRNSFGLSGSLNKMQHAVDRLLNVFEATRCRKKFDEAILEPDFETFEVEPYIKKTLNAAAVFWGERFKFRNATPHNYRLHADRQLLQTVLFNLFDNAIKYSPPDSPVILKESILGDWLELTVNNNTSIPLPLDIEALFQKFSRGSNSADTAGTGQGLYIARGIVTQHGGSLEMSDVSGTVQVTMRLPLMPADAGEIT